MPKNIIPFHSNSWIDGCPCAHASEVKHAIEVNDCTQSRCQKRNTFQFPIRELRKPLRLRVRSDESSLTSTIGALDHLIKWCFKTIILFHFQFVNWRMPLRLSVRNHICQKRNTFSFPICESIEALALTRPKSWILIEINYLITWCSKTIILFHLKFVNWRTPLRLRVWSHESLLRSTILRNRHAKTVILFHFQFVNWRKPLHLCVQNDASWLRSTIFRIKISFFLFLYFWIGIDAWRWGFTGHAILL